MQNLKTLKINNQFDDKCYQDNKFKIVDSSENQGGDTILRVKLCLEC